MLHPESGVFIQKHMRLYAVLLKFILTIFICRNIKNMQNTQVAF